MSWQRTYFQSSTLGPKELILLKMLKYQPVSYYLLIFVRYQISYNPRILIKGISEKGWSNSVILQIEEERPLGDKVTCTHGQIYQQCQLRSKTSRVSERRPPDLVTLHTDTAFQREKRHSSTDRIWIAFLHHL